jgi:hypothetical protein
MDTGEITGNQGKEITWLRVRIFPDGKVAVRSLDVSSFLTVSIGEEDGHRALFASIRTV